MVLSSVTSSSWLLTICTVLLLSTSSMFLRCCEGKKDRNVPHIHNGKIKRYQPGPFANLQLTNADKKQLELGHSVMKQTEPGKDGSGSAICIQDVNAPIQAVWYQILDMDSYHKKVSKVNENKNYVVQKNRDGTCVIKTKQVLGVLPGYSYESYFDHMYYPKQNSLTWTLDYGKSSDFDDVAGHWHVEDISQGDIQQPKCRVYYACDIKMKGTVPGPILNYISKQALKQATSWVKRESETHPMNAIPVKYGGTGGTISIPSNPTAAAAATGTLVAMKKQKNTNSWFQKNKVAMVVPPGGGAAVNEHSFRTVHGLQSFWGGVQQRLGTISKQL